MATALITAVAVLFILNIGLLAAVLALARQVGVLFERISPIGALTLDHGPKIGDAAPRLNLTALSGEAIAIGAATGSSQLLFFLSPTCPICKKLLPVLRSLATAERGRLDIVLASDGDATEHRDFWHREKIGLPYVLSPELGIGFQIGKLPYAVLIGPDGHVRAKGLVNSREQIESLLEAEERGVASMQEFLAQQKAAAE
jgi:methylamine dehydrogenase accessory protein MauD